MGGIWVEALAVVVVVVGLTWALTLASTVSNKVKGWSGYCRTRAAAAM